MFSWFPVNTGRFLNVDLTSIERYGRQNNVIYLLGYTIKRKYSSIEFHLKQEYVRPHYTIGETGFSLINTKRYLNVDSTL